MSKFLSKLRRSRGSEDEGEDYRPRTAPSSTANRATRRRSRSRPKTTDGQKPPKCRPRIDQLAIPSRRLILALYQEHAQHLPDDKVEKLKELLQELYAMTPEETEKYFEHLRNKAKENSRKRNIKFMLKKLVKKRKKAQQIKKAYEFINKLLVDGMQYALQNPVPPLVSIRLRNLSNIILEQICDLRNVDIPNREDPDDRGMLLIQIADWMAIAIEHLYYGVQLKKNKELEKIETEARAREAAKKDKSATDASEDEASKPPKFEEEGAEDEPEAVISEPLQVSEME